MKLKALIALSLFTGCVNTCLPWGQKGHDTVVFIAENHLTPSTKAAVDSIFDGRSMVYYANWMDNASHTPEYAYSSTWHYKNIDADETFATAELNENGDIITAIVEQVDVLKDKNVSKNDKQLALKMVIHLMGDIHQPMHLGHKSDRGGNGHKVKYFGRDNNLHSVWDSSLPESAHKWSYSEWQQQIDRATDEELLSILNNGNPSTWAEETYKICKQVYDSTPVGSNISYDYIAVNTPIIEQQFLRGGLRLADLLNSIFDNTYESKNSLVKR